MTENKLNARIRTIFTKLNVLSNDFRKVFRKLLNITDYHIMIDRIILNNKLIINGIKVRHRFKEDSFANETQRGE